MINLRQTERMSAKVSRLSRVYEPYLIKSRTPVPVYREGDMGKEPVAEGSEWGGNFAVADFYFTMPEHPEGCYLEVDDGGVENLIVVNGTPYGMTDWVRGAREAIFRAHRYVLLEGVPAGASVRIQAYASHKIAGTQPYEAEQTFSLLEVEEKRVFRGIFLVEMRRDVQEFLENLRMFESLMRAVPEADWLKYEQYPVYEKLFCVCSMLPEEPGDLGEANECFRAFFATLPQGREKPYLGLIGHSHLDTAWLWTVEETRRKAVRTASNAVTLLKRHPEYKFFMSTVLYLDWIERDYPALFEELKPLVKEGRFEPNGATWVECDCNLTGGEAMIRQFLRGKLYLREKFGYESDVFWLPDTFGYSAALPQIMQGCGVKYFLTTKLSWNDTNSFPYESFRWQGVDGSEVLVHFNTIHSEADPEFLMRRMKTCKESRFQDSLLVAYGYGDGGGGPSEEMVSRALKTQTLFPWGKVEHTTVSSFMKRLEGKELPRYCGELYLELHRGTLTSGHELKRNNRLLENALRNSEYFSVATSNPDWKKTTDACYDTLMLNQFHDILPGTCIDEVNVQSIAETDGAIAKLNALLRGSGKGEYYNTLSFAREETLEAEGGAEYVDFDGNKHAVARFAFPPFGRGSRLDKTAAVRYEAGVVTTPYLRAEINGGKIVSLQYGGREFAAGALGEVRVSECVPLQWDNWDIDADYPLKEKEAEFISTEVIPVAGMGLRLRSVFSVGKHSTLTTDMVFDGFSPEIRFENKLDYRETRSLIRVYFPTNLLSPTVKSEIQFGYLERSVYRNTSETQAQFEACNHRWSDLSETNAGIALLNDCKYGFTCEGGTMSLTLIKSASHPDRSNFQGVKYFTYSLVPHDGGFSAERVVEPALRLNSPPVYSAYAPQSPVKELTAKGILVETVKYKERGKGIIVRLYECERSRTQTELVLNGSYTLVECNMLEDEIQELGRGERFRLEFKPFEIKTFLLKN